MILIVWFLRTIASPCLVKLNLRVKFHENIPEGYSPDTKCNKTTGKRNPTITNVPLFSSGRVQKRSSLKGKT